ncbi:MAG: FAD binding domain-containing protein [Ilumatobacteraceae bacterium]
MIPAPFRHVRARTLTEALDALATHGDEAKLLAGGHSLIPLMKLRLATPSVLIDIARLSEFAGIRRTGDHLTIGALTRHVEVERSPIVRECAPLLCYTASLVGDPQVRNRGTIGGSVAHGDSASDLPVSLLALNAVFVAQGPRGQRTIPAAEFFVGFWQTALAADELLVEIRLPINVAGWSYQKFTTRSQDWATVSVAVAGDRIALGAMAEVPLRAYAVETALAGGASVSEAAHHADEGSSPSSDLRASADYRRHLSRVLTVAALEEAASRRSGQP